MSRTKKNRFIQIAPQFCGFRPLGYHGHNKADIAITFEEYEALKLCDYELLTQEKAATLMNVSRPTFTRIYESVRRKIAIAFAEGSSIRFEEGHVKIASWLRCPNCLIVFTPNKNNQNICPFCKKEVNTDPIKT